MGRVGWTVIATLALAGAAAAQDPEVVAGHWEGEIEMPGRALAVKVDLEVAAGAWSGAIDIPAQGAKRLPLGGVEVSAGSDGVAVRFAIAGVPGDPTFAGKLAEDRITGTFTQGPAQLPFSLGRDAIAGPARPQEPKAPFPYASEDVRYASGDAELAGTLTVPAGDGPFPAVLLISGSGPQNRDEEIFGHKPFAVLADHLGRAGIVVLRVDDAGVGGSTAHSTPPTTADLAKDAEAGVAFLKADMRIDPHRIGLLGHSEGGAIAPLVASRSHDVAFVVLLAGPGVPGTELLRKQNQRIFTAAGFPQARQEKLLALLDELFDALLNEPDEARRHERVVAVVREQMELNGVQAGEQTADVVERASSQAESPWMRYFLAYDPRPALRATQVPVLALGGDRDVQVDTEQNLAAIATALAEGGNQDVTVHRYPDLNHLFQHARTGLVAEYGQIEETMAPEVLETIRDWILAR